MSDAAPADAPPPSSSPPASDEQPAPAAVPCAPLDAAIARKLVKNGDRERIKRLLADRLEQCGWRDAVASLAAAELAAADAAGAPTTAPRVAAALADRAREAVPDGVKAQFLDTLRGLLVNAS